MEGGGESLSEMRVSRDAARRFLLEYLQLGPRREGMRDSGKTPGDWVRSLEAVQIDPVARVGRNQDLVLYTRHPSYRPRMLDRLLTQRQVFEYRANEASVIPMEDYPLFAGIRHRVRNRLSAELSQYDPIKQAVLEKIGHEGPLPTRAFVTDQKAVGYWDKEAVTKVTSHVLALMFDVGELTVGQRDGLTRYFDLPERVVPSDVYDVAQHIELQQADEGLFDKYVRAYRLVNGRDSRLGWSGLPMAERRRMLEQRLIQGIMVEVRIDGVRSPYYVLAEDEERLRWWDAEGRGWQRPIRFVPPLDNLLWDRARLMDLFDFYYRWEVYVPAHKRQFGVYAMPILAGDHIAGRIDPELDRGQRVMRIRNQDWTTGVRRTSKFEESVQSAMERWALGLGADCLEPYYAHTQNTHDKEINADGDTEVPGLPEGDNAGDDSG